MKGGDNTKYDANDIQTLNFRDAVRTKLGMYLSADKQEAMQLGLREIIYNTRDEYEQGFGNQVIIDLDTDKNQISVLDNARGIPCGIRKDGINSLTAACTMSHTGAKHEEGVYSGAVGINGIGLKVVCLTAKEFKVRVYRDSKIYEQDFLEGKPVTEVNECAQTDAIRTGTEIIYTPSLEVYGNTKIDVAQVKDSLQEISYFTKGFTFILNVISKGKTSTFTYKSENGLADALNSKNRIHDNFLHYEDIINDVKIEFALQWVTDHAQLKSFANNLEVKEGGAFMTGFKTSLTKAFNTQAKCSFSGEVIRKYLDGYVSVKVKIPQFSNQAKTALANVEARTATSTAITKAINIFANKYHEDFNTIVEYLKKETKAEEAADRARMAIINAQNKIVSNRAKKIVLPEKLKDAEILGEDATLLIVEGNSAMAGLAAGRDHQHFGLLAIRGKIKNLLSCPLDEGLENEEVQSILTALGCGILNKYDSKKLRYGKVGIAVDADDDGSHIACLIMALFKAIMPQFIEENRLCWLKAPLYKVVKNKQAYYFYDDAELSASAIKGEQTRYKGLGEMGAEDVKNSMFNHENQRLEILKPDENSFIRLDELMGADVTPRKDFVFSGAIDFSQILD